MLNSFEIKYKIYDKKNQFYKKKNIKKFIIIANFNYKLDDCTSIFASGYSSVSISSILGANVVSQRIQHIIPRLIGVFNEIIDFLLIIEIFIEQYPLLLVAVLLLMVIVEPHIL